MQSNIAKQTGKPRTDTVRGCVLIRIGGLYRTHKAVTGVKAERVLIRIGESHRTHKDLFSARIVVDCILMHINKNYNSYKNEGVNDIIFN